MSETVVESFTLDHTKVKAPYVRVIETQAGPNGGSITNYDLRLTQPNETSIETGGLHSLEHLFAGLVRDEIDVDILEELLFLGDLGIQYCIKSEKGYANLHELESELLSVPFADFNDKYNERDIAARENMRKLIDSDANKVTKVFSTLI